MTKRRLTFVSIPKYWGHRGYSLQVKSKTQPHWLWEVHSELTEDNKYYNGRCPEHSEL